MISLKNRFLLLLVSLSLLGMPRYATAQTKPAQEPSIQPKIEAKAIALLKAMSGRLAAARSLQFTAVTTYESPSRIGPPLVYTTLSEVTLMRPNQLRVITPGDGSATEFYYNGKTITAYSPAENLVAVAEAPTNLDAALKLAYDSADIYFPFTDVIVKNPYQDIAEGLKAAFVMGQSRVVGGTTTDIVVLVNDQVFAQIWIGTEDKLPRRIRAVYREDPSRLRHQVDFDHWQLDKPVPANAFASAEAQRALPVPFARPEPTLTPKSPQKKQ
jgi:hypothetical protein